MLLELKVYAVKVHYRINLKLIPTAERKRNVVFYIFCKRFEFIGSMLYLLTDTMDFVMNVHITSGLSE